MKAVVQSVLLAMVSAMLVIAAASVASASEVVTLNHAQGATYSIMAYNSSTSSYYYLTGTVGSDSYQITVPKGYSSSLTVAVGRRVGTRNLYAEHDPLNPIFDVSNKSTYVLEFQYIGTRSSSKAMGAPMVKSAPSLFSDGAAANKRFPPQ